jgi:hypothetical protein
LIVCLVDHKARKLANATIGYNANGNMVSDGSRSHVCGGANRLSGVTQGGATTTLDYGPSGTRVKKSNAFATTLYPDANVDTIANRGRIPTRATRIQT